MIYICRLLAFASFTAVNMPELGPRHHVLPLPRKWPQDNLRIPDSGGWMPEVDTYNAKVTRREFRVLSGSIPAISYGQLKTVTMQTEQSGDFYACSLGVNIIDSTGQAFDAPLWGTITVVDARTEFDYTYGGVQLGFFAKAPSYPTTTVQPWRRSEFIQPMIFTRNGAISVNIAVTPRAGVDAHNYRIDLTFDGWIEYQYASI